MLTHRWQGIAAAVFGFSALVCGRPTSTTASTIASAAACPNAPDVVTQGHDWTRFDWDVGRSGVSTAPTGITAAQLSTMCRQQVTLEGTVDASAIYLSDVQVNGAPHDAFFVTTTYGKTIAVNANTGAILWTYTPPAYASWVGTAQITNATPVADPNRQFLYAASPDGHVQKLTVASGSPVWSTAVTMSAQSEKIASALNYFAGRVFAVTDGYVGDAPPYQGHVAVLDAASGQLVHVWNSLCSNQHTLMQPSQCQQSGSGIWGRAGAVIDSTTGDIYVATGNGLWDGQTNWGDATLELDSAATQLLGNYTPTDTHTLDVNDVDLGSTSPVLLGGGELAQGGKDGIIRTLAATTFAGASPHIGGEAQTLSTPSGTDLFATPAIWRTTSGTWLFAADGGATAAWTVSAGRLSLAWRNGNAGTSPVVAGGLLFVYDPRGTLRVYQPATGALVATLGCGGGHWNSPIVVDGKIALPEGSANYHTASGVLDIWRSP
jgi:outer membrane protein assembly factor BamB